MTIGTDADVPDLERLTRRRAELLDELRAVQKHFRRQGLRFMPEAPQLPQEVIDDCRLVATREDILKRIGHRAVCAEIGVARGVFSKSILAHVAPDELHLFDTSFRALDREFYDPLVAEGRIELHKGDSSSNLAKFPDAHFDFIYIDGDHGLEGVLKDCAVAARKIKPSGIVGFNDYTPWSVNEMIPYGGMTAVNRFCIEHGWRFKFMSISRKGHHDVFVEKVAA